MKSKSRRIWLLWQCVIFMRLISLVKLESDPCEWSRCKKSDTEPDTNISDCIDNNGITIIQLKLNSNGKLSITCEKKGSDTWKSIANQTDCVKADSIIKSIEIENCPIPDVPYINIFNVINLSSVTHLHTIDSRFPVKEPPENLFKGMINLQELNLAGNQMKKLPRNIFEPLQKLTHLHLNNNNLNSLDENIFQPLKNLKHLGLSENRLDNLTSNLFSSLTKLENLSMSSNNMRTLNYGIFNGLEKLTELYLEHNSLSLVPLQPFNNNSNTNDSFQNQDFTPPQKFFSHLKSLETLNLSENNLTFISEELFHDTTQLKKLYLDNNRLSRLSKKSFQKLQNLKLLHIRKNRLENVRTEIFSGLGHLIELDLSGNQLNSCFDDGGSLGYKEKVNLGNNLLNRMRWNSLVFGQTKELDLSFNKFEILQTNDFTSFTPSIDMRIYLNNSQIKRIDLNLSTLQNEHYKPGQPIVTFTIAENLIDCNCTALNLAQFIRNGSNSRIILSPDNARCKTPDSVKDDLLKDVDLKKLKCPIEENCPSGTKQNCTCYYRSYDNIAEVNCTSTGISEFPQKLPTYNDSNVPSTNHKYELYFANNTITSMQGLLNLPQHNITILNLSSNQLETIENISNLKALQILELDNNRLKYLNKEIVDQIWKAKNLKNISLHNNPWECDCDTKSLWSFIRSNDTKVTNLDIRCKGNGDLIHLLTENKLCPMQLIIMLICIFLAILLSIITAAVILYHKYKRELKVWIFANPYLRWMVTEKEVDEDKEYDAFVSYAHEDHDYVKNELRKTLEERYKFKLCVHYRDFMPGGFISDLINEVVENSRRTIIVLSPNFVESTWCQQEFVRAHLQDIKERRRRVIVIMLEDVTNHEKLHRELKAYINTVTYLKADDPRFYRKLVYLMPHYRLTNITEHETDNELELQEIV